jgi:hypothetical protein
MERRTLLTLLAVAPAAAILAACGADDSRSSGATDEVPPATEVPVEGPNRSDEPVSAVFEFGYYGGFTTREVAFQMQPQVLVTSDGRVITPGASAAIYPGPLLPTDTVQTITAVGIDALFAAANDAGLLAEVSYPANENIADASTATLRITVDGVTYVHEAYALGIGGLEQDLESDRFPERQSLEAFISRLGDLPALVGAENLGAPEPYVPDAYQLFAASAGDLSALDVAPTVLDWPAGTGVKLADASTCSEVDAAVAGEVLEAATQLTFFVQDGETYAVTARPAYPGRTC